MSFYCPAYPARPRRALHDSFDPLSKRTHHRNLHTKTVNQRRRCRLRGEQKILWNTGKRVIGRDKTEKIKGKDRQKACFTGFLV